MRFWSLVLLLLVVVVCRAESTADPYPYPHNHIHNQTTPTSVDASPRSTPSTEVVGTPASEVQTTHELRGTRFMSRSASSSRLPELGRASGTGSFAALHMGAVRCCPVTASSAALSRGSWSGGRVQVVEVYVTRTVDRIVVSHGLMEKEEEKKKKKKKKMGTAFTRTTRMGGGGLSWGKEYFECGRATGACGC
ncbi:uncharacterized protein L3040_006411 [Drepanopeziza brunnea f. sp. 'multigermtubi']|uniref:uncharacterized protein n=1 Tax=Drepanopeziza brunnea f. sp. 'multigermtubi' TaxID=698441 RepID=UPI00238C1EC8|nr:hypothetical protein L3040_006411 [Drepanopeziza brunnea f. sp. 'multigermtubi']